MNHYPYYVSSDREAVTADLTASVKELAYDRAPGLGKAVALTLRTLGIDRITTPPHPSDLLVIGSADKVADRLPSLRKTIATIASSAVDPEDSAHKRRIIGDIIDNLTQNVIPTSLNKQGGFIEVVGESLSEFGEECNDDGCLVEYGRRVGWYSTVRGYEEASRNIPSYVFDNVTDLEILNTDKQTEGVSFTTRLLASRARMRLVRDPEAAKLLKKKSRALGEFEMLLCRDLKAFNRLRERYAQQRGGNLEDMILAEDIIHTLLDQELEVMNIEDGNRPS